MALLKIAGTAEECLRWGAQKTQSVRYPWKNAAENTGKRYSKAGSVKIEPIRAGAKWTWQFIICVEKIPSRFHDNVFMKVLCGLESLFLCSISSETVHHFTPPQSPSHKPEIMPKGLYPTSPYNNLSLENLNYAFDWITMLWTNLHQPKPLLVRLLIVNRFMNSRLYSLPFLLIKVPGILTA